MKIISSDQNVVDQARALGFNAKRLLLVGAYEKIVSSDNAKDVHGHHTPAQDAYPQPNRYANRFDDPRLSLLMTPKDHMDTASYGGGKGSKPSVYRQKQAAYIEQGDFRKAVEMDIKDLQRINTDGRYDPSIEALKERLKEMERNGEIPYQQQQRRTPNRNQTAPSVAPSRAQPRDILNFPEVIDPRDNPREQNQTPPTNRPSSIPTRGNSKPEDILNFPPVTDPRKPKSSDGKESSALPKAIDTNNSQRSEATNKQHEEEMVKFVNGANKYLDANGNAKRHEILNAGLQAMDQDYALSPANRDQIIKLLGVAKENLTPPKTAMRPKANENKRGRQLGR